MVLFPVKPIDWISSRRVPQPSNGKSERRFKRYLFTDQVCWVYPGVVFQGVLFLLAGTSERFSGHTRSRGKGHKYSPFHTVLPVLTLVRVACSSPPIPTSCIHQVLDPGAALGNFIPTQVGIFIPARLGKNRPALTAF